MARCRVFFVAPLLLMLAACAGSPRSASPLPTDEPGQPRQTAVPVMPSPPAPAPALAAAQEPASDSAREVLFAYRSTRVPQKALPMLSEIAKSLKSDRLHHVTLIAHADSMGSREFSVAIASKRAAAVEAELLKLGVRPTQIRKHSMGNAKVPRGGCGTEACRQNMRRVELQLWERDRRQSTSD